MSAPIPLGPPPIMPAESSVASRGRGGGRGRSGRGRGGRGQAPTVRGGITKRGRGRGGPPRPISGGREGRDEDWQQLEGSSQTVSRPPDIGPPPAPAQWPPPPGSSSLLVPPPPPSRRPHAGPSQAAQSSKLTTPEARTIPKAKSSKPDDAPNPGSAKRTKKRKEKRKNSASGTVGQVSAVTSESSANLRRAYSNNRSFAAIREDRGARPQERTPFIRDFPVTRFSAFNTPNDGDNVPPQRTQRPPPVAPRALLPRARHADYNNMQDDDLDNRPASTAYDAIMDDYEVEDTPLAEDRSQGEAVSRSAPVACQRPLVEGNDDGARYSPSRPVAALSLEDEPSAVQSDTANGGAIATSNGNEGQTEMNWAAEEMYKDVDELASASESEITNDPGPDLQKGCEWHPMPDNCSPRFESNRKRRDANRRKLTGPLIQRLLEEQSRRVTRVLWRDDGCGLDWELVERPAEATIANQQAEVTQVTSNAVQHSQTPVVAQPSPAPSSIQGAQASVSNAMSAPQVPSAPHSRSASVVTSRGSSRTRIALSEPTPLSAQIPAVITPVPSSPASPSPTVISISSDNSDDDMDVVSDLNTAATTITNDPSDTDSSDSDTTMSTDTDTTDDESPGPLARAAESNRRPFGNPTTVASPTSVEQTLIRIHGTVKRMPVMQANDKLRFMCALEDRQRIMTFSSRSLIQIYDAETLNHQVRTANPSLMPSGHLVQAGALVEPDYFVMTTERPRFDGDQLIVARIAKRAIQYSCLANPRGEHRLDSICKASPGCFVTGGPSGKGEHVVSRWKYERVAGARPRLDLNGPVIPIHHNHVNTITSIAYSAATQHMVSGSLDTKAIVWDLGSNGLVHTIAAGRPIHQVHLCDFSGGFLAALELAGSEYEIYDSRQSTRIRHFSWGPQSTPASKSRFEKGSFNGIHFTSGHAEDGSIKIWDIRNHSAPIVSQTLKSVNDTREKRDEVGVKQVMMDGQRQRLFVLSKTKLIRHNFQWT